jgi:hypothetical protein
VTIGKEVVQLLLVFLPIPNAVGVEKAVVAIGMIASRRKDSFIISKERETAIVFVSVGGECVVESCWCLFGFECQQQQQQ